MKTVFRKARNLTLEIDARNLKLENEAQNLIPKHKNSVYFSLF